MLALLALAILFASGCGASEGGDYGGSHPNYTKALADAPAPLAALYKQGDELLGGGTSAYEKQIAELRGYPIVVNLWASWCVPCRAEFPTLQKLSSRYGKRVAFLGVNSEDSSDAAETFLREAPLPYPSYSDPDKDIYDSVEGYGFPNTAFYDRSGELVYVHKGQYANEGDLEADMRTYALQGG
ncbi:MAG TPA: TlpA disulfide reductase family protein [Solirubrobacterales bacterium]|nr:TlpA disulfide reductase family protein [Solirubrobacterales bacterium]